MRPATAFCAATRSRAGTSRSACAPAPEAMPSSCQHLARRLERRLGRAGQVERPALQHGLVEEAARAGHRQQAGDVHRARRLAEDRDVARIAAEGRDLVAHPLERGHLVEHGLVAGAVEPAPQLPAAQEAEGPEPVVDR